MDSFRCRERLTVGDRTYTYYSLEAAERHGLAGVSRLPVAHKIILECLLRNEDGKSVTAEDISGLVDAALNANAGREIAFRPARVLMPDTTGLPVIQDLAAMREALQEAGADPDKIECQIPAHLIVDHSIIVETFGSHEALSRNLAIEYARNGERYRFLRWAQLAFRGLQVIPPGAGICHQINLEHIARVVWTRSEGDDELAFPDTVIGADSHTTMVNGIGVLGWGVGGIEVEAAMLNMPITMLLPAVIGIELVGVLREGVTSTDLALSITETLRKTGVVGKIVEFHGAGVGRLSAEDRATVSNMAPEYGATCSFFPADAETLRYLAATGRGADQLALVEAYTRAQGMFGDTQNGGTVYADRLRIDLSDIEACVAGPKRPQDRIALSSVKQTFRDSFQAEFGRPMGKEQRPENDAVSALGDGAVVLAAITSCANTSNPALMIAAGLLARNAVAHGLHTRPWVKTSFAPGSRVVSDYLENAGLQESLDALNFHLVGYGCTTCIGNSGPLLSDVAEAIDAGDLVASAVLSGNRNFEGRINARVRANYLASPPLVVAYGIAGRIDFDFEKEPLGHDENGKPVFLKDIWPSAPEVVDVVRTMVRRELYETRYRDVLIGSDEWRAIDIASSRTYPWDKASTYVCKPPQFEGGAQAVDIEGARILALLGDSITSDHISPAGSISIDSPAGKYLSGLNIAPTEFNQYSTRRGNHEVMMRGTFANSRLKNHMAGGKTGGFTTHWPSGQSMSIFDAAMRYREDEIPLVIVAGKEYGTGSSRDSAAKGPRLLGVRAVIAESFERIHRSNLVGVGVLPLTFEAGTNWRSLKLTGTETVAIRGLAERLTPRCTLTAEITYADRSVVSVPLVCRLDTNEDVENFRAGGILSSVLRRLLVQ